MLGAKSLPVCVIVLLLVISITASHAQSVRDGQKPTATASKQKHLNAQLWYAANQKDCIKVKALLEQGANPNTRDPYPEFYFASRQGTVLMEAAALGDVATVKVLLAHGAFINARGVSLYAGGRGRYQDSSALIEACLRGENEDVVRVLVERGANVNVHDKGGTTPLSASMWQSEWATAWFLVQHGARSSKAERKLIMVRLETNRPVCRTA